MKGVKGIGCGRGVFAAAGLCFFISACSFQSPTEYFEIRTPGTWASASSGNEGKISTGWLDEFSDRRMKQIVYEALENNRSLKAAAAVLRAAREDTIIARADQLPAVDANTRAQIRDDSLASVEQNYGLSLGASWEPDLWGRLRDLTKAAQADERVAVEDFRAARLSLAANTAGAYTNLVSAEQEVNLAVFTLESFEKVLRIIERNYKSTGEGALDIQFARTNVSSAKRALETRKQEREDAARTLEVFLGRYPGGKMRVSDRLPDLPNSIPAGVPAGLVERRSDLAAARAVILASAKRADASRKALLPDLSLTGSSGSNGARFSDLTNLDFLVNTITANLDQIVFDGGSQAASARQFIATNERRVEEYAQLALEAFQEVESTLAAERSLAAQEKFLKSEVEQANLAEKLAERDYAEGINANILSILEAQRRANNARAAQIRLRNQRLQNRFDLHLALGGDYRTTAR